MNRRQALKRVGLLLGGAVSASVAGGVLAGCGARPGGYTPQTLTRAQDALVTAAAGRILPATDTPGAADVGVSAFVDGIVTTAYTDAERSRFMAGLADLDARAVAATGRPFAESTGAEQDAVLAALARDAAAERAGGAETPFFFMLKELVLVGYYTSEVGATQELKYVHAAGRYDGDVPFAEVGRAYA